MLWNWQLAKWPKFTYDKELLIQKERQFLVEIGKSAILLKSVGTDQYHQFLVEILSLEGLESSKIEGEMLDRASLQSSIKCHFGLQDDKKRVGRKETGMAEALCNLYQTYAKPLSHELLWNWYKRLLNNDEGYRTHAEPMQIVSRRLDRTRVFFEAPPSSRILHEMTQFIEWYNSQSKDEPILGQAAILHVYFESIHPFEDGNGRVGRLLIEKFLSQSIGYPLLIAVSSVLESRKKEYYASLESCNRSLDATRWVNFFAECVLQAQKDSVAKLVFLLKKSNLLTSLAGKINARQEKALLRMLKDGTEGFIGGMSAEKYISITKASRATATRDLADLVTYGALVKTGTLRHTRYFLNFEEPV